MPVQSEAHYAQDDAELRPGWLLLSYCDLLELTTKKYRWGAGWTLDINHRRARDLIARSNWNQSHPVEDM
jgi:hypothetical protein